MDSLQTIDIQRILALSPLVDEYSLGKDFILGELCGPRVQQNRAVLDLLHYPIRFDGYIILFLRKGQCRLDLNLHPYELREGTLLVNVPGSIIRLSALNDGRLVDVDLVFMLISRDFMGSIPVDFHQVFQDSVRLWNTPCVELDAEDRQLLERYFALIRDVLSSDRLPGKREILEPLITSLTAVCQDVWKRQLTAPGRAPAPSCLRRNQLFERFMALVTEYHVTERRVAFYAEQMSLTPKYLSKIIKQTTGRSAPEWIDAFVILEAKHMLKYSDKSIKEIVYALHFPNQSVFYKYFKVHTGLTPTEYRKG